MWSRGIRCRACVRDDPAQRKGDFSDAARDTTFSSAGTTGCLPTGGLHDPDPTNPGGAFTASGSTPGVIDIIPAGRQSTAGSTILNTYFLPTLAPGSPGYGCGINWAKSLRQPDSRYGLEIGALLAQPDDAPPEEVRVHADKLKQIEDQLESA